MSTATLQEKNMAIVREAFDAVFNKKDETALERFWAADYIQHSARVGGGREGLRALVSQLPKTAKHEIALIAAEGDFVMLHGRYSGIGQPKAWIAADIIRMSEGKLAEHWDVIEDEARVDESAGGNPMFGDKFSEV